MDLVFIDTNGVRTTYSADNAKRDARHIAKQAKLKLDMFYIEHFEHNGRTRLAVHLRNSDGTITRHTMAI